MQERSTLARPYALAVFKLASEQDKLEVWSEMLAFVADVVRDPQVAALVGDPRIEKPRIASLVIEVAGGRLTEQGQNLIKVLAGNGRLGLAEEIASLYEEEKAEAEKRERVHVTSAYAVNAKFQKVITEAMERRLGRTVELETEIDRSLIGGVIIRAGDMVIDASLKGRLHQLAARLG